MINPKRVKKINKFNDSKGPVIYWMSREQRVLDNWSLLFAQEKSIIMDVPLVVCFCVIPNFLDATLRQYDFMLEGLKEVENTFNEYSIEFVVLTGKPENEIPKYVNKIKAGALITDFDPLKIKRGWVEKINQKVEVSFYEVDSHNIIPCRVASSKQEYAAYTLRPKLSRILREYLLEFPKPRKLNSNFRNQTNWNKIYNSLKVIKKVKPVDWIKPGEKRAKKILKKFLRDKLQFYHIHKNNPDKDVLSNLSPYLHFGQISAQRVALDVVNSYSLREAKEVFLEELITRRELADNFCYYNNDYDSFKGFQEWAKKTLDEHLKDKREFIYSKKEFESAKTHDDVWNAAQMEMVRTGKMHGYLRMYWAKKILEWTESPDEAMKIAIFLNDRYSLDGRDANGYAGIAWSIGGIHDRAWNERPIFGKVRYMSYNGLKSKFDTGNYVEKYL
jgi:deoxyribodipyrimidine photo-lyase